MNIKLVSTLTVLSFALVLSTAAFAQWGGGGAGGSGGKAAPAEGGGSGGARGIGGGGAKGESRGKAPALQDRGFSGGGGAGGAVAGGGRTIMVSRVHIGIAMDRVSDALAAHVGVEPDEAILVVNVAEGGPADEAGLQRFDIIMAVDGESPVTTQSIRRTLREKEPGDQITLSVLRAGREEHIVLTLADPPTQGAAVGGMIGSIELAPEILVEIGVAPEQVKELPLRFRQRMREYRPEINEHLRRLRKESDSLRETLQREWREHWSEFEIDEETRERVGSWLDRAADGAAAALERAAKSLENVEVEIDVRAPRVEILRERGGGRGLVVHPDEAARLRALAREYDRLGELYRQDHLHNEAAPRANEREDQVEREMHRPGPEMERRLGALEERLERMEQMMRRLLERESE